MEEEEEEDYPSIGDAVNGHVLKRHWIFALVLAMSHAAVKYVDQKWIPCAIYTFISSTHVILLILPRKKSLGKHNQPV